MSADSLKQRQVDFAVLLELHAHAIANLHLVHRATHDVGGEKNAGRAIDSNTRNDIRDRKAGTPLLVVDGEGVDDAGPRDSFRLDPLRKALSTHRARRMDEGRAVPATHEPQFAARPCGPEEAVV